MTLRAFKDSNDGYYQVDLQDGEPLPAWMAGFTETELIPPDPKLVILEQICLLENSITPRRIREAVLGIDNGWLAGVNNQIAVLRSSL